MATRTAALMPPTMSARTVGNARRARKTKPRASWAGHPAPLWADRRRVRGNDGDLPARSLGDGDLQLPLHIVRDIWGRALFEVDERAQEDLSLIHISEPTRLGMISYAVF